MKNLLTLQRLMLVLLGASFLFIYSCKKDKDPAPVELLPKLDGFYIYGSNTVASSATDPTARMNLAVLDSFKVPNIKSAPGYYGKFLYIGANSTIKFAQVINEVGVSYGAADGGSIDSTTVIGNMDAKDLAIHGDLVEGEDEIKVAEEGLYYAFVIATTDVPSFILTKVKTNVIGDATENGWGKQTDMVQVNSSVDSTSWSITGINLWAEHGYKYRLPKGGWQFYAATDEVITVSSLAVKNYGEAWAAPVNPIGLFNENIPTQVSGTYNLRVTYIAATDTWKEYKKKTGDWAPSIDYTDYHMGLWGDAFVVPGSNPADTAGWDLPYDSKTPAKAGKVYTWTWSNVHLIEGREFIFIKDGSWGGGLIIDGAGVASITGDATTSDVHKGDGPNVHVYTTDEYDVTLRIDANVTNEVAARTVTINKH